jgi:hypothetical protein
VERGSSSERETRTNPRGAFTFAGLPVGGLRVFLVSTDYAGVSYQTAQRIVLTPDAPVREAPVEVYDAGADRSVLHGTLLFSVVDIVPGAVRVTTIEQIHNTGTRTIVSTPGQPMAFALPANAVAVEPLDGWRDPRVEDGRLTDTRPVAPGDAQLTYAYQARPKAGRVSLLWRPPFGAARVEILVSDTTDGVVTSGLGDAGVVTASGRRYRHWSGGPVARGGLLSVRLGGVPDGVDRWPGVAAGALAVALAAGLASALRRGAGEPRGGVEAKFPAHISPRTAVRRSAHPGTEESKAACPPKDGDGVPLRRSLS